MASKRTVANDGAAASPDPPIPASVREIADPAMRQQAADAWRAASRLRRLIDEWRRWFLQLKTTGDAHPGLAILLEERSRACVQAIFRLGIESPTFKSHSADELMAHLPRSPSGELNPPWNEDEEYLRSGLDQVGQLYRFQGELWNVLKLLEVAPSTAFTNRQAVKDDDDASLTECQRDILNLIRSENRRLVTNRVLEKLEGMHGESTIKGALADFVKDEYLNNCSKCRPRGYGLPTWVHEHTAKSRRKPRR